LLPKSNNVNTIGKFLNEEVECVKMLNHLYEDNNLTLSLSPKSETLTKQKRRSVVETVNEKRNSIFQLPVINRGKGNKNINNKKTLEILSRRENLAKLENIEKEKQLEKKLAELIEKMKEFKIEIHKLINQVVNAQNESDSFKLEIEVLENYDKFQEKGLISESNSKRGDKSKIRKQNEKEMMFFASTNLEKELLERQSKKEEFKNLIKEKALQIQILKIKIDEMKSSVKYTSDQVKSIKNELFTHYYTLLNEGRDTRQEGLVWIIKAIWSIGYNPIISMMPNFLDEISIDYLFTLAHKDYEIQRVSRNIQELKHILKSYFGQNQGKKRSGSIFQTTINIVK
jgi:hypothetical protein